MKRRLYLYFLSNTTAIAVQGARRRPFFMILKYSRIKLFADGVLDCEKRESFVPRKFKHIWYSTVGRSIADIYDRGIIFTEAQSAKVNMFAELGYRGCGPTYRATYNILYGECATGRHF